MRIDWWTLALQTVNVLILVGLLGRFLFRPVVRIIDERRAAAAKVVSDAEAAMKQAVATRGAAEAEGARIAAARDAVLQQAAKDAEALRAGALASAREEVDRLRASTETEMRRTRAADEAAASDRSARLAADIAGKLLQRLPDSARVDGFVEGLAQALASLPAASRDGLYGGGGRPRLTAARPLTPEETQRCRDAFAKALGRPLDFDVAADPRLIAGLELETPHAIVSNSFRNDIARIVEELTRHDHVRGR